MWGAVLALHINSTQEAWRCAIGNVEQQRGDSREPIRGWECRGGVVVIDDGNQSSTALNGALWRHTHQSLVRGSCSRDCLLAPHTVCCEEPKTMRRSLSKNMSIGYTLCSRLRRILDSMRTAQVVPWRQCVCVCVGWRCAVGGTL